MPYFINLCRCCLSSDIPQTTTNEYLCKEEQFPFKTTDYYENVSYIYPDLQLKRSFPFNLCNDCQRLLCEATEMKRFLNYQLKDKQSQQLLIKESMCSGCTQFCSSLFDKMDISIPLDVCNKSYIDILKVAFPYYPFQSHISHQYCKLCSNYVKSVYLLKELLAVNNALYEKYCSTLTASSEQVIYSSLMIVIKTKSVAVDCNNSTEMNMSIKEEISIDSDSIEFKFKNNYGISNNLSNDTRNKYRKNQQQKYDNLEWSHTEGKHYKCNICLKSFSRSAKLQIHIQTHTGDKPFSCNICPEAFSSNKILKIHELSHTRKKLHKCNICSKAFSKNLNLKTHIRTHTGEKPYECNMCPKAYTSKSYLVTHKRIHSVEELYKCNTCQKAFCRKGSLTSHKYIHTGEKRYKCKICLKEFTQSCNLNRHKIIHTGEKPYKCKICPKAFTQSSHLNKHKFIHTGEKLYKCDICKKAFYRKDKLMLHKRIHTGEKKEKPYKCNICLKSFSENSKLRIHKRIHTGEKPYKCNICPKAYTENSALNNHKKIHTGEKLYKCNTCQEAFFTKGSLKAHERIHTGMKLYKCNICPKAYTSSSNLNKHKKIHTREKQVPSLSLKKERNDENMLGGVDCFNSTQTDMLIKDEISIDGDSLEFKFENKYDIGNDLFSNIRGDYKIDQQDLNLRDSL